MLLIPECVFHGSLCVQALGSGFASSSTGKGLKALGAGGTWEFSALCVLLRAWQHEEKLGKGRKAGRVRAEEHPVASRRSQTQ